LDRGALKELLVGITERVELHPSTLECRLHYRINAGEFVASPWGFESNSGVILVAYMSVLSPRAPRRAGVRPVGFPIRLLIEGSADV
jgi:hypothetical protein